MAARLMEPELVARSALIDRFSRGWMLPSVAAVFLGLGSLAPTDEMKLTALFGGLVLGMVGAILRAMAWLRRRAETRHRAVVMAMVGQDAAPCFTTDEAGQIRYRNKIAAERFGEATDETLVGALQDHFASPSAVLFRLKTRARLHGAAREDVVTRRGHLRLSAHGLPDGNYLWRLEEFQERSAVGRGAETLSLPMMTANKAGVVLFSNEAMRRLLGERPRRLDRVFAASCHSGEEVEVSTLTGPVRAILTEIQSIGERREIYLLPVPDHRTGATPTDVENVPVPLMTWTAEGELISANRAARDLLAIDTATEPLFHELFEGLGRPVGDWLSDVVQGRMPTASEVLRSRHSTESETYVQVTLRRSLDGGRPCALAILQDATALKTLEAQFVQSQKMQAIGQLAGGVAHDFNNLLTAISGHCDLLLLRHTRDDPEFADLVQIHQNANRAAALVSQLLAFSRKQTLKPERLELEDVLSDISHLLNRLVGEKMRLKLVQGADLGPIRADRRQLEQVLMNLVVNARDAMPEGGTIRIETEAVHLDEDLARDRAHVPAGDYALIKVSDTGVGIPADRLDKIFEPFFTTKQTGEGTGLGLSTAYGIVKQSGGYIFVDSVVGEGTTFRLYFPVHDGPIEARPPSFASNRAQVMRPGEGVVLLVEDEAPVRAFASRALRMRGYTVLEAENAEDALRTLEDSALEVDVFVTDVVMPGMDGPTWVRQALERRPNARVVFVSGYAEEAVNENQTRIPNSVFLPKPFSLNELTNTVQGQLA